MRAFGPELAEVPLLATRHELQGNALAPLLLCNIEKALHQAGVQNVIMPALPLSEGLSPEAPLAAGHNMAPVPESKPWGLCVGYRVALPAQLLQACKLPTLQLPGTCYLTKQLSPESFTQVSSAAAPLLHCWFTIAPTMISPHLLHRLTIVSPQLLGSSTVVSPHAPQVLLLVFLCCRPSCFCLRQTLSCAYRSSRSLRPSG